MDVIDPVALTRTVLWLAFGVAFVFGLILQRTHFCTMGAISDIVNMGDWSRMRMWLLAIGVAILGTQGLAATGTIHLDQAVYTGPRLLWLSSICGGLLFGIGMVLGSGCGTKTLVRIGGGNLKALVVFVVLGISSFMAMKGIFAVARVASVDKFAVDLAVGQDIPRLLADSLGWSTAMAHGIFGAIFGGALLLFVLIRRDFWTFDNLFGGIATGLCVVALWYVSGKIGYVAEHPDTLQEAYLATNSGRMESLSFVAPYGYTIDWLMFFSDTSKHLTIGIVSVIGLVLGSLAYALVTRSFLWEGFGGTEDLANHLIGAVLMGVGGVMAMGCTVGQGLSGLSTLSLSSFITFAAILLGGRLGIAYQMYRLEKMV
jgi:uncharacterized protein